MENITTGQRPTFLTVLCIISFMWGLYSMYQSVQSAFTEAPRRNFEEVQLEMEKGMAEMDQDKMEVMGSVVSSTIEMAQLSVDNAKEIGYTGIFQSVISIIGVWMMWNLRRTGFWLYAASGLIGLVTFVMFLGTGLMAMLSLVGVGFITVLFIVLYAIHLKYMS